MPSQNFNLEFLLERLIKIVLSCDVSTLIRMTCKSFYSRCDKILTFAFSFQGSWADVRGAKSVLIISLLSSCVCYFLLGTIHSIPVIILLRIALGRRPVQNSSCWIELKIIILFRMCKANTNPLQSTNRKSFAKRPACTRVWTKQRSCQYRFYYRADYRWTFI